MSTVFITGGTGYLGSYVVHELLQRDPDVRVQLLVRAADEDMAVDKLWRALQFHVDDDGFAAVLPRIDLVRGDLHAPDLGLSEAAADRVLGEATSVIHLAASLNRKSSRACFDTNLRGTLHVLKLAQRIAEVGRLERFSEVSTSAVAGKRSHEVVLEDRAIEWDRSDYDPYARTKKFSEYLTEQLLPGVRQLVFRPTTVMGDSRHADGRCWQTDMTRVTCGIADLPVVPIDPDARLDFVTADFVGEAIARLHLAPEPRHRIYHLSAGEGSTTGRRIADALAADGQGRLRFAPRLSGSFELAARVMNRLPRRTGLKGLGAVLKVFWPYIVYDTVMDNTRVTSELQLQPVPWEQVMPGMRSYCASVNHTNPERPRRVTARPSVH